MFMTLKYGREDSDDIQYLASANRPDRLANANLSKSACTACRRKKVNTCSTTASFRLMPNRSHVFPETFVMPQTHETSAG